MRTLPSGSTPRPRPARAPPQLHRTGGTDRIGPAEARGSLPRPIPVPHHPPRRAVRTERSVHTAPPEEICKMPGFTPFSSARRTGRGRPWRTVLVAGLASTLLVACGGGGDSGSGSGSSGGVQEVTFLNILPLASLTFTPDLVADSCGYFEKHGLKVSFETTQGSPPAIQTVLAGKALLTRIGDLEVMQANGAKNADLLAVGTVNKTTTIRFISAKSDPLNSAEDLKGRLMGTPSAGGTSEQLLKLTAASAGISPGA